MRPGIGFNNAHYDSSYNIIASSSFQPNANYSSADRGGMHHNMYHDRIPPPMHHDRMMPPPMIGSADFHNQMPPKDYGGYHPPVMHKMGHAPPYHGQAQSSYSFLDPIIQPDKMYSPAQNLLKPQKEKITEVYKKLYIGKIPLDMKDNLVERLLKCCGSIESWKRAIDTNGNPKAFGYCEFEDIESAVVCLKTMNDLDVGDCNLVVNADSKTKEFLNNWILKKKEEWINLQKGLEKELDLEEFKRLEDNNELTPWIKDLISIHAGDIYSKFEEILNL